MGGFDQSLNRYGKNNFRRTLRVTATGTTALLTIPALSAVATPYGPKSGFRCVVCGYTVSGYNTNAAATTIQIRNDTTTTSLLYTGAIAPTTGLINIAMSPTWHPMVAAEGLQLNVGGSLTGEVNVTVEGFYMPCGQDDTQANSYGPALCDKYTGIAP